MSKINEIQNALIQIDAAEFQKLGDCFLYKKQFGKIIPNGSVFGKNKVRKGTPDTLFETENGKYIFVEYTTTAESRLIKKIEDDINKCLNVEKHGIELEEIERIVIVVNGEIDRLELREIAKKCHNNGIIFELYNNNGLSFEIYQEFPDIAYDFLGISIDTGQIISIDEFVSINENNNLKVTLKNQFLHREEELKVSLDNIKQNTIVLISGNPGVGKTKIGLEILKRFSEKNPDYKSYCVYDNGQNVFNDIKSYFSVNGKFVIFIDDANRLNDLSLFTDHSLRKREGQIFKFIITVRDYAKEEVLSEIKKIGNVYCLEISKFKEKEIQEIIKSIYPNFNKLALDRIEILAQGNARIALMAGKLAQESGLLESIRNITSLYSEYFKNFTDKLKDLNNTEFLLTGSVISLYISIDKSNEILMKEIENCFSLDSETFWKCSEKLHELEIVDIYSNEVVKISDQILGTHMFYLTFFEKKLINVEIFINFFFFNRSRRKIFTDIMNPIISIYDDEKIKCFLKPYINKILKNNENNEEDFLDFLSYFYFIDFIKTLTVVKEKIDLLDNIEVIDNLVIDSKKAEEIPKFIIPLIYMKKIYKEQVLDLLFFYFENKNKNINTFIKTLKESYCIERYTQTFDIQKLLLEKLIQKSNQGKNVFYTKIFLEIAEYYIGFEFSSFGRTIRENMTFYRIKLVESNALREFRNMIFEYLNLLLNNNIEMLKIKEILLSYIDNARICDEKAIIENDFVKLYPVFQNFNCKKQIIKLVMISEYLDILKQKEISFSIDFKTGNYSKVLSYYNLIETIDKRILDLNNEEFKSFKIESIKNEITDYNLDDFINLFDNLNFFKMDNRKEYELNDNINLLFQLLPEINKNLFFKILMEFLKRDYSFNLYPVPILENISDKKIKQDLIDFIFSENFKYKERWIYSYYMTKSKEDITKEIVKELKKIYINYSYESFCNNLDFLVKYEEVENGTIHEIIKILFDRTKKEPEFEVILKNLFNPFSKVFRFIFKLEFSFLKEIYLFLDSNINNHFDYNGIIFSFLMEKDMNFFEDFLKIKEQNDKYLSGYDRSRDFSLLWKKDNYYEIMEFISRKIYEISDFYFFSNYLDVYFKNNKKEEEIENRQFNFLKMQIFYNAKDIDYMVYLFTLKKDSELFKKELLYFGFLEKNKNIEDFKKIVFPNSSETWHGSRIPLLYEKIDFLEMLLNFKKINSLDYLDHLCFLNEMIESYRKEIEKEKKHDFIKNL